MTMTKTLFTLTALASLAACTAHPEPVAPPSPRAEPVPATPPAAAPPSAETVDAGRSTNAFGIDLYQQLRSRDGNLAFSPTSVGLALHMTRAGAHGSTAATMAQVLHVPAGNDAGTHAPFGAMVRQMNAGDRPYTLAVANRLFGEKTMEFGQPFLDLTASTYDAPLEEVDFRGAPAAARQRINGWVEDRTQDRIVDLLPNGSIDASARLVLANAVYFKGSWKTEFDADATRDAAFFAPTGEVTAPLMTGEQTLAYAAADGMQLVDLPYEGGTASMTLLVPTERDGLPALEARLTEGALRGWLALASPEKVRLHLPRFRLESAPLRLKKPLMGLGMGEAFDPARANFEGLSPEPGLAIDEAYHQAFVEVNEEGTEAAAATAVVITKEAVAVDDGPKRVRADRPFLFLIRDRASGAILFLGRVTDPT